MQAKFIWFIFLFSFVAISADAYSQSFQVGIIEIYGNYTIPDKTLREKLAVTTSDFMHADSFARDQELFTNRLLTVPGVKRAYIAAICCTPENKLILFAGVDEKDSAAFSYRKAPSGKMKLPKEVTDNYNDLMKIEQEAIVKGNPTEDDTKGHALLNYPPAKPIQDKTISYAKKYLADLRKVLHTSADGDQRAVAVQVIAYAPDKKEIVSDLLYAVKDDNEDVRNNATRALVVIAGYANEKPELGIKIPASVFINMLNSVVWSDRNKAGFVLMKLTDKNDKAILEDVKKKAVPALLQMAKWKDASHSESFYVIAGRAAGFSNQEITDAFYSSKQDSLYSEIVKRLQAPGN